MEAGLKEEFPLHWSVWHNELAKLSDLLEGEQINIEKKDPRGRTPLMLAVTLGHLECSKLLLQHSADANAENKAYWSVAHEVVSTGDPELLLLILQHRDFQRSQRSKRAAANLLSRLRDTPDFYAEMRWEFTSWIPFVSKMCPSDTYKVYKKGSTVRIDTTLIGFDATQQWQRGNQTLLFTGSEDGRFAEISIIDHQLRTVFMGEKWRINQPDAMTRPLVRDGEHQEDWTLTDFRPSEFEISMRLTSPIVTTYVDVDKISFERSKSGLPGWRSDRNETVNGYPCRVYTATNVELITKTRVEHLTERDKVEQENRNSTPLDSLLKYVQGAETKQEDKRVEDSVPIFSQNPSGITAEEYFNSMVDLGARDIGRPKQVSRRSQTFKANLWLSNDFPLSLQEQITPIVDLMAANNAHFARLKNFIELQLPAGFPVKIEIPLFHVINAKITFGNVFGETQNVDGVTCVEKELEDGGKTKVCVIDSTVFDIPADYRRADEENASRESEGERGLRPYRAPGQHGSLWGSQAEEDMLLQFAIQQSLRECGQSVSDDRNSELPPPIPYGATDPFVDLELQRAINASLALDEQSLPSYGSNGDLPSEDLSLEEVLEMSKREEEERLRRLEEQEEDELKKALEMSLTEK